MHRRAYPFYIVLLEKYVWERILTEAADPARCCCDAVASSARCLRNLISGIRLAAENCTIVLNTILAYLRLL